MINDIKFKENHRLNAKSFTRKRKLTFVIVMLLMMQKSLKSMQLVLNEFFTKMDFLFTVTSSAFSQARCNFSHTAFIELNQKATIETVYENNDYKTYRGFRLLAIDGSKVILPDESAIREKFGTIRIANQDEKVAGEYPVGMASICYDLLNHVALDSVLAHSKAYEVDLAIGHLQYAKPNDLFITDRNYSSYRYLASHVQRGHDYLSRCSRSSFKEARAMFDQNIESQIVTLRPHHTKAKETESLGLPMEITVRFVRIILNTGEVEILVTSLLDVNLYSIEEFKELYHMRWGIETFYGVIKGRLNLENFTGKSVESILQDFHAAIFISGLESVLTEDAQIELDNTSRENKYPKTVNKAVSFNAIKNHVIDLLFKEENIDAMLNRLTQLFLTSPVSVRKHRKVPRKKSKPRKLINYHKRKRKICF